MNKLTWYHNLGFYENPFSIKPAAFHDEILGNESLFKKISKKIEDSNFIIIHGEYGTGKSTILKRIIHKFGGKKQVAYFNCHEIEGGIDFESLLINAGGFFRRLFRIKKRNMILLLDEAQDIHKKDIENLKAYYDDGFFKSVVLVSKKEDNHTEIEKLAGENIFKIGNLGKEEAIELVRKRIGPLEFFPDEMITKIFELDKNPRMFLKNCEDVCRLASEDGAEEVTKAHVEKVLGK